MNAVVWTTFALVVVVAPTVAVGAGTALRTFGRSRRSPLRVDAPETQPAPVVVELTTTAAPQIVVEPRPGGRWAVRKEGAKRASRVFDTKDDAIALARTQAERDGGELMVMDEDGRIEPMGTSADTRSIAA